MTSAMDAQVDSNGTAKLDQTRDVTAEKEWRKTGELYQILICVIANLTVLGPSMGFGYSAVALPVLTTNSTNGLNLDEQQASWIASALAIGTPFGCILCSFVLRRGRKLSLLVTSAVSLIAWLIIFFSKTYEQILLGRALSGLAMGLASVPSTVYSAEVTSTRLRSTALTWASITIACGVLIVYVFGYLLPEDWALVALLCAAFPFSTIILTALFLPESPLWLSERGRLDEATKVVKKLNGIPEKYSLTPELEAQIRPKTLRQKRQFKLKNELLSRKAVEPLAIMLTYFFFQQFSGVFAIVYYAVSVTFDAGLTVDGYLGAIMIGLTRLLGTLIVASASDRFGRRIPSIASGVGMTIFMSILAIYLFLVKGGHSIGDGGLIPAVCLMMYIFTSTFGFLVMPFAMVGEVYPASVRDLLSGFTTSVAYIFSFVTVKIYPDMLNLMDQEGVFLFYAGMSLLGTLFVIGFLPETKGKSLTEIEQLFGGKRSKKFLEVVANGSVERDRDIMIPLKDVTSSS